MSNDNEWYSDAALAKQATLQAMLDRGERVSIIDMMGVLEPRVQPTEAETCPNCGADARAEVGGEEHHGRRWCALCVGRGRHE